MRDPVAQAMQAGHPVRDHQRIRLVRKAVAQCVVPQAALRARPNLSLEIAFAREELHPGSEGDMGDDVVVIGSDSTPGM